MKQAENRVFTIPGVPGHDSCNLSGPGFCVPGSNAFVHGALSSELCRPAAKKGGKWLRGVAACRQEGSYLPERGYGRYFALFP